MKPIDRRIPNARSARRENQADAGERRTDARRMLQDVRRIGAADPTRTTRTRVSGREKDAVSFEERRTLLHSTFSWIGLARSEGMSETTLLSFIKQKDAIDWYARATSQQLLPTWEDFKRFAERVPPSGYSPILRLKASFRLQGTVESFAKYYNDISALFCFVDPPIPADKKFFLVNKNMNEN